MLTVVGAEVGQANERALVLTGLCNLSAAGTASVWVR